MIDELPWDDLRYLEALERTGKVGIAAREQKVSVSTFYRRVAEIERRVGQLCLVRSPQGATLSAFGLALARVGRRVRGGLNEVFAELRSKETSLEGEVTLTTVQALLPFVEPALVSLSRTQPKLTVSLHLGDDGPSVRRREVDLALGVMKRPPEGCVGRRVMKLTAGVFATREAMTRSQWVLRSLDEATSPESAWERKYAGAAVVRAPFHAVVTACAAGAGLALLPREIAALHRELIEVESFAPHTTKLDRAVWLLVHEDQRRTPRVVEVMNALTREWKALA